LLTINCYIQVKPTELEEECAKTLTALEQSNKDIQKDLRMVFINSVEEVEYQVECSAQKYILIRIPFRSITFFSKVNKQMIDHLEEKFKWPVIVVVNRTIDSMRKITHPSQKRPRSRTLKAVHAAILNDVCTPSQIVGRRARQSQATGFTEQVFLDPLDKMLVEDKLDAMAHAYQKMTTHKITISFAKPTSFQKKKLEKLNERRRD
jgi:small subunit ribosomal protein S7e